MTSIDRPPVCSLQLASVSDRLWGPSLLLQSVFMLTCAIPWGTWIYSTLRAYTSPYSCCILWGTSPGWYRPEPEMLIKNVAIKFSYLNWQKMYRGSNLWVMILVMSSFPPSTLQESSYTTRDSLPLLPVPFLWLIYVWGHYKAPTILRLQEHCNSLALRLLY